MYKMTKDKEHKLTVNGTHCPECGQPMTYAEASEQFAKYDCYACHSCTDGKGVIKYDNSLQSAHITEISYIDALCLFQKTPSKHVKIRPGRGGKSVQYVTGEYMKRCATIMTNGRWGSTIDSIEVIGNTVVCVGSVSLTTDTGEIIKISQAGGSEIKCKKGTDKIIDISDDYKSAITDMVKKCLSEIGIAHDVYSGEAKK